MIYIYILYVTTTSAVQCVFHIFVDMTLKDEVEKSEIFQILSVNLFLHFHMAVQNVQRNPRNDKCTLQHI